MDITFDGYIYIQYTIPRPSFGTEKGVPFYFCSIWFFLLGSGGPKKKTLGMFCTNEGLGYEESP